MSRLIYVFLSLFFVVNSACSGPRSQTILSFEGLSCASCGPHTVKSLVTLDGVQEAVFNQEKVEVSIVYDPAKQSPSKLSARVKQLGYPNVVGAGQGSYASEQKAPSGADIKTLRPSDANLDIQELVVKGRVTVIDFFAVWCGPCRVVDSVVKEMMSNSPDITYRRIDIGTWSSAISKRYLGKVPQLPYVIVFDKSGQRLDDISGLDLVRLKSAIERGRNP